MAGSFLGFILFPDWIRLLRTYRFAISPRYYPRALAASSLSLALFGVAKILGLVSRGRAIGDLDDVVIEDPPIFIVGYARSGTTHLHNMLARDERFASPNLFHVAFPRGQYYEEPKGMRWLRSKIGPERRPFDNVAVDLDSPQEEELAMMIWNGYSPMAFHVFPRERNVWLRFFDFEGCPAAFEKWKRNYLWFVKKLSVIFPSKRLLFKSPQHIGRIARLRELFPKAKFIHIHRNPYQVFLSNKKLHMDMGKYVQLQTVSEAEIEDAILETYAHAYALFLRDRDSIAKNDFCELSYDELCAAPVATVERIYRELQLDGLERLRPRLEAYLATLAGYEKGRHERLTPEKKARVYQAWKVFFGRWGYAA